MIRCVPTRRAIALAIILELSLIACQSEFDPSKVGPTPPSAAAPPSVVGAVDPSARVDTFLCRLATTTQREHGRLVHAMGAWDSGDRANAASEAREAFAAVSSAMSNRPRLALPPDGDPGIGLVLTWSGVALSEMTLASALAPDVRPILVPQVEAHAALTNLEGALSAARTTSRQVDPLGGQCGVIW